MQHLENLNQKTNVKTTGNLTAAALPPNTAATRQLSSSLTVTPSDAARPKQALHSGEDEIEISEASYELSLAEFPLFILSTRIPKDIKAINYKDTIKGADGKPTERHWRVTWNKNFGPPGQSAAATFFALYQIWKDDNFESEWIHFETVAALLKRKGIVRNKQTHERIIRDLECLRTISIEAKNAFYDKTEKKYIDRSFNLFVDLIVKKDTPGSPDAKSKGYIKAHPLLHQAAQKTSFLLGIPEKQFFELSSLQQRLFLHLKKMFCFYGVYTRRIDELAAQLPIVASTHKAKFMLKQAANGLFEVGIMPFYDKVTFLKNNIIRFEKTSPDGEQQLELFDNTKDIKTQKENTKEMTERNYQMILDNCKDTHSYLFYHKVAALMDTDDIYRALSETRDFGHRSGNGFMPKYFTSRIKHIAKERNIYITEQVD